MAYFERERANQIPYSVGNRVYGGGLPAPNTGPVDPSGYAQRDAEYAARRTAVLRRLQAMQKGDYASPAAQRSV